MLKPFLGLFQIVELNNKELMEYYKELKAAKNKIVEYCKDYVQEVKDVNKELKLRAKNIDNTLNIIENNRRKKALEEDEFNWDLH